MLVGPSTSKLSPSLFNPYLHLFQKCRTMDHLKQIHSIFVTTGLSEDTFSVTKIRHFCAISQFGDLRYALLVVDQIRKPNTLVWNTMMRGLSFASHPEKSFLLFVKMLREGIIPDRSTYSLLLKAFAKSNKKNPNQIHAQTLKLGLELDLFVRNSLISAYANCGHLGCARQLFGEIFQRDLITWTAMIDGYVRNNLAKEGLDLFMKMRSADVEIDEVTIVSVLCATGIVKDVWFGRWIHGFYVECGRVTWDVYVGSALVDMYAKCGYCDDAQQLFDEIPSRNVVSWSALIAGYVQGGRFKEALFVFQDMLLEKVEPNQATLTSVLTACAQLGALDQGRWIHLYIDKNKLGLNMALGTALIDMYAKCGCINEAFTVFHLLPHKDVYPWTAMINGLAMHGHALRSLDLFTCMQRSGVRPNEVTFIGVLCACSHRGLVDQGLIYFDCMSRIYGIEPNVEHYGCVIDLLGRGGYLEEALKLIENMPMEPSAGVWGALFGACMIHKDFDLGERIGKHLIKLQPHRSGRYALLANMYSVSQKWEEAACIRKLMKEQGVEKAPGCSWIEVSGFIHEFIALDNSHSQYKAIHVVLDLISTQMRLEGYVPDAALLLSGMDVE